MTDPRLNNGDTSRITVAVIGTVGLPARYGGFETLVDHLQKKLGTQLDLHVFCSAAEYRDRRRSYENATLHYVNLPANGALSIPYDIISMIRACRIADLILVLGVSGAAFIPVVRLFSKVTIVSNIDGIEWRRDKWGAIAKWLLRRFEAAAVNYSDTVIADNACIAEYVEQTYGRTPECIAYGGDHATKVTVNEAHRSRFPFLQSDYAVKVCRIEPENNVHVVLEAFEKQSRMPLVVVGNWQASHYGQALFEKHANSDSLTLLEPIYEPDALNCIRSNAALYVHGHSAGGTNPSLVEAMSLELPVLAFDVDYNRATTEGCAVYFDDVLSLERCLSGLDHGRLSKNRARMSEIASRRYTWRVIASQYQQVLQPNIETL